MSDLITCQNSGVRCPWHVCRPGSLPAQAGRKGSHVTGGGLLHMDWQPPQLPWLDHEVQVATSFSTSVLPFVLEVTESPLIPFVGTVLWRGGGCGSGVESPVLGWPLLRWRLETVSTQASSAPSTHGYLRPGRTYFGAWNPKSWLGGRRVQLFGAPFSTLI